MRSSTPRSSTRPRGHRAGSTVCAACSTATCAYVEAGTFPGGCFFATVLVEVSMQPGAVRDRLVAFMRDWIGRLEDAMRDAQREGDIDKSEDAGQLAFELECGAAARQHPVLRDPEPRADRARAPGDRAPPGGGGRLEAANDGRPPEPPAVHRRHDATGSPTGSGRMTTVSATVQISSAGMPTRRRACESPLGRPPGRCRRFPACRPPRRSRSCGSTGPPSGTPHPRPASSARRPASTSAGDAQAFLRRIA